MGCLGKREAVFLRGGRRIWCAASLMMVWWAVNGCEKTAYVDDYGLEPGGRVKGLRAAITSDKEVYEVGEPIKIAYQLENITKEEVGIIQIVGAGLKHLRFEIRDRQGKETAYALRQPEVPLARWARMTTIKPHSSWFLREIINKDDYIFEENGIWKTPGKYSITALFEGVAREDIEENPDIKTGEDVKGFSGRLWFGRIKSNVITIETVDSEQATLKL